METIAAFLPWLIFAACPIMMLWMMRGGGGCHNQGKQQQEDAGDAAGTDGGVRGDVAEEINVLKARLARLEAERSETSERRSEPASAGWRDGA